jgi:hypothetical protein
MKIKHNKLRNTGILFELLVRRVASDVLDGKTDSFAVKMMKEHFHSKTELGKELQLYRSFFNAPKLSEANAVEMLNLVSKKRQSLNEKLLDLQKFLLIKEIKQHCDLKQFMAGRVPSYKVYASAYKLFEYNKKADTDIDTFTQIDEVIIAKSVILEHLKGTLREEKIIKESTYSDVIKDQPTEIRHLSYKFLLESFNEKYSVFNTKQKMLLREYINNGTDLEKFAKYISNEAKNIISSLLLNKNKIKNEVTHIKINEVVTQLKHIQDKGVCKDNYITALLIAYQISHELETLV